MSSDILNQTQTTLNQAGTVSHDDATCCDSKTLMEPRNFAARLQEMANRNFDAIAADLDDLSNDPDACERRARALATVTLALDEIARVRTPHQAMQTDDHMAECQAQSGEVTPPPEECVVDEDDPRACPRDLAAFRATLAARLDNFGEKKNIST